MADHQELLASVLRDQQLASAEAQRLAQLRDDVDVKVRFGLATFNAASLVALVSAMGAAPDFLHSIGITGAIAVFDLVAFAVGVVLAGVSIYSTQNELTLRAGHAAARASNTQKTALAISRGDRTRFEEGLEADSALLTASLQRHSVAIYAQHFSGGAWLAAVLTPLLHSVGLT